MVDIFFPLSLFLSPPILLISSFLQHKHSGHVPHLRAQSILTPAPTPRATTLTTGPILVVSYKQFVTSLRVECDRGTSPQGRHVVPVCS
jgi:hypothetical protein